MSPPRTELHFGIVVPVKPPAVAKSRLGGLGDRARHALAAAFAADTVEAAARSPLVGLVLAVTDDHWLARQLSCVGAQVVPDAATDDLNGSLVQAAHEVRRRRPDLSVAALCADLPALRTEHLTASLRRSQDALSFVADREGTGTTLLAAPDPELFAPRFGSGSRAAHLEAGAVEVDLADIESLRLDVDTPTDLTAALALGVGRHTSGTVSGLRL